jgi:hypothetical protein
LAEEGEDMTPKLGEILIKRKLVTQDQLDEALKQHSIYGIKLGSSLMVMGYLDEDRLSQLLSDSLGVPQAGHNDVLGADKAALEKLTGELASKYRSIPFRLERNRLSVAMSDPSNYKGIEELGFITGCIVVPHIAPDALISKALSEFYRISSSRFSYQLVTRRDNQEDTIQQAATVTFPIPMDSGEIVDVTVPAEFEGFANLPEYSEEAAEDDTAEMRGGKASSERYSMDQLSMDLTKADNREDVADEVMRYLGQEYNSCALFSIQDKNVKGWRSMHLGVRLRSCERWSGSLDKPSVLQEVALLRNYIHGSLADNPDNKKLRSLLKLQPLQEVLVMPVIMQHDVLAIVLVSVDREALRWRLKELGNVVRKMSLAFEKIIIKQKILMG